MDITRLVKPNVRKLHAYQAEEIPCKVKLDANESPYGFRVLHSVKTNRYPDPEAKSLRELIAKRYKVKPEAVLHGNGSDELIYYLITTFGGPVLYPVPTFSMYGIISQSLNEIKIEVPLDDAFDLDENKILNVIKKDKPKLIFLSSPNNPTGNCFSADRMLKVVQHSKGLVIIDEAYQPFSEKKSFLPMLKKHKNLVILRTLSKIGLAGLRTGFMIANPEIINMVNKVRLPFNLNSLSQKVALDSLRNSRKMDSVVSSIISERKRLFRAMQRLEDVTLFPSDANFILFRVEHADVVFKNLLEKGVLIRYIGEISNGCLRVTVGTPKENSAFLKALREVL